MDIIEARKILSEQDLEDSSLESTIDSLCQEAVSQPTSYRDKGGPLWPYMKVVRVLRRLLEKYTTLYEKVSEEL